MLSTLIKTTTQSIWSGIPGSLRGLIRAMRPKDWSKNGFIFAGILFDQQLTNADALLRILATFALFSLTASAVYLMNDLVDIERDRQHPRKRNRPLPSGQLPVSLAMGAAVFLPIFTIGSALLMSWPLAAILAIYFIKQVGYSFYLKNVVLLDVFTVAAGFVLRTIAGVVVIEVTNFSPWLYVCAGLLALFLGVGKRRQELILLQEAESVSDVTTVRTTFKNYNLSLLDDMLRMVVTACAIAYTLYAVEAETALVATEYMLMTVPFVYYALFRYLYLIHVEGKGGDPTDVLFEDRPLLASIGLWGLLLVVLLYIVG